MQNLKYVTITYLSVQLYTKLHLTMYESVSVMLVKISSH